MRKEDSFVKAWLVAAGMLGVVVAMVVGIPVGAHHASAPFYDSEKSVEANGAVSYTHLTLPTKA